MFSQETENSFQRTRLSADRTLMSTIRTALALIGFGFTIFQFFKQLQQLEGAEKVFRVHAPRNLGMTLVLLGVGLLLLGIVHHFRFMRELNKERRQLFGEAFTKADPLPWSSTMAAAIVLAVIGLLVILSIVVRAGPFQ